MAQLPTDNSIHAIADSLAAKAQDVRITSTPPGQYWDGVSGIYNVKLPADTDATAGHDGDDSHKSGLLGIVCEPIS